jgi:hypothetical protein
MRQRELVVPRCRAFSIARYVKTIEYPYAFKAAWDRREMKPSVSMSDLSIALRPAAAT